MKLRELGQSGAPLVTDGGNYILDCACKAIPNVRETAVALSMIPGVVEHGLFINIARTVIIGDDDGAEILEFES